MLSQQFVLDNIDYTHTDTGYLIDRYLEMRISKWTIVLTEEWSCDLVEKKNQYIFHV